MAATRLLRTTGRVVPDENKTYPIVAAVSGWIRKVENVTTGDVVKKDQTLASFFSPDPQLETLGAQRDSSADDDDRDQKVDAQIPLRAEHMDDPLGRVVEAVDQARRAAGPRQRLETRPPVALPPRRRRDAHASSASRAVISSPWS